MLLSSYLLLWLPAVQQKIKDIALTEVMKIAGNHIQIGKLSFHPFNKLKLENVYIEDLKGDTLFYASQVSADFDLMPVFRDTLLIKSIYLDDFTIFLSKDSTTAPFNFQFLIDAFSSKDTTTSQKSGGLKIEIDDVKFSNGTMKYDILSAALLAEDLFDSNHIHIENLKAHLQLKSIDMEQLNAQIKSFAFREKSGFELKNLKAELHSKGKLFLLKNLELQLPSSKILLSDLQVDYSGMEPGQIANSANYSLNFGPNYIWPADLKAFYPPFAHFSDSLYLESKLVGKLPEISLTEFKANLGTNISIDASASIRDYKNWSESPLKIAINKLAVNKKGINIIGNLSTTSVSSKQSYPLLNDPVELSGTLSGILSDLDIRLNASSNTAQLAIKGNAGYLAQSGAVRCDLNIDIDRLRFNDYVYREIQAHATYSNDSISLHLNSADPNVPLQITASGNLSPSKESVHLLAKIDHIRLDTTNWLQQYPGADLYTNLSVDIKGFNPEKMTAQLILDSLIFKTNKNTFKDSRLKINYKATDKNAKNMTIRSDVLEADVHGNFTLNSIASSFQQTLSEYLPGIFPPGKNRLTSYDQLDFSLRLNHSEILNEIFDIPFLILEPANLNGKYQAHNGLLDLDADIPKAQMNTMDLSHTFINLQTDTTLKKINLTAGTSRMLNKADSMQVSLKSETIEKGATLEVRIINKTDQMSLDGALSADIHFISEKKSKIPNISINLKPTPLKINNQTFHLTPAAITLFLQDKKYTIANFALTHSESEYVQINGAISSNPTDTLKLNIARIQLKTLTDAARLNLNLTGEANGEIILNRLLSTPLIITNGFSIKDITMENKKIGTLNLKSAWSEQLNGIRLDANLIREGSPVSSITGHLLPHKDSLNLKIDIQSIPLDWMSPFTAGTLYGLNGEAGTQIQATGKLSKPTLDGIFYLKNAHVGLNMTQAQYKISDTLLIKPDQIIIDHFRITDENNQSAILNGTISHQNFTTFNPKLTLNLDHFLVVNNSNQTDSLFYGTLRISGTITATKSDKDILLNALLTNNDNSSIMINLPESATEAHRYSSITFIHTGEDTTKQVITRNTPVISKSAMPVKLKMSLTTTPGLKLGAVINPSTRDAVSVTGSGNIDLSYDLSNNDMNLLGVYTVNEGQASLSLKNITKKTFSIRKGGTLTFKGDPMSTAFDITAVYSTRADLATLDKSFEDIMATTKVPVNALLTASGDLNQITLKYNFEFPNQSEDITRKAEGLLYTDELKIKEIAYLLAFNSFSESKNTATNLWTSLASSSLTSQLNNLLSGVLNENWSIGTELHSNDNNFSDMEMDVNVSTRLFNDRMTVNSNFGYRNAPTNNTNNFTGDFDVQLKLNQSGSFILKVYNVTNTNYSDKAKTTQGVGVVYQREARTFKKLFQKIKKLIK